VDDQGAIEIRLLSRPGALSAAASGEPRSLPHERSTGRIGPPVGSIDCGGYRARLRPSQTAREGTPLRHQSTRRSAKHFSARMFLMRIARCNCAALVALTIASVPAVWTAASTPAIASSSVYFTTFAGGLVPETNTLKMRPSAIQMSGDASWIIGRIRWSSWGGATAKGTGTSDVETCEPQCADGGVKTTTSHITLTTLGTLAGHRVYKCMTVTSSGGSDFARRRAKVTHWCPL